ncbi:hypothetical protein N9A62_00555 [Akkermansiaceae bacterium]|nr:hypothetical protein [Akkermansiaceae bacterium]
MSPYEVRLVGFLEIEGHSKFAGNLVGRTDTLQKKILTIGKVGGLVPLNFVERPLGHQVVFKGLALAEGEGCG